MTTVLEIRRADDLTAIAPAAWDALVPLDFPFFRHAFIAGLERFDCLEAHGWYPNHLLAWRNERLIGALPLYIRTNSRGEFVFDYAWADAYERTGRPYYPKLVSAVPFSPVSGPRILLAPGLDDPDTVAESLVQAALREAESLSVSSLHVLFPDDADKRRWLDQDFLIRAGCQYHWHNHDYQDFDDFLSRLNSKHRKQLRRERREVAATDVRLEVLDGHRIDERTWRAFYEFYCSTFHRKWGEPRFTLEFMQHLGVAMADETLLFMASRNRRYVAGAFALRGRETLYGRHWGCNEYHRNLHFELCYYKTIDYCIAHGLSKLDAGAQGEHKLSRGFTPHTTWSAHWLREPDFARAVADFLQRETTAVDQYVAAASGALPYKRG